MLVLLAAPASGLQAPGALRMHRGDSFAVASASRGAALTMQAGDDRAAVESKRARFLRPLRSASTSVAATVLLALVGPRGAARAAVLEAPTHSATTNSRSVENAAAPFTLRTLSPRRGTVDQMEEDLAESRRDAESADVAPYGTDMEQLVGRGMGRQFMSRDLIFGEELTEMTPLQEELDELDEYTSEGDGFIGKFKGSFTYLATGGVVYGVVKILQAAEEFFITSEKQTMQEEMDLTGMYIAIDDGEAVEGAIDPKTGKNITISGQENLAKASDASDGEPSADMPAAGARTRERGYPLAAPACDSPCTARSLPLRAPLHPRPLLAHPAAPRAGMEAEAKPKEEAPWLLRVLGLGDSTGSDDMEFWADKLPPPPKIPNPNQPKPTGTSPTGGAAAKGKGEEESEEADADTEGIDTLEDLLG